MAILILLLLFGSPTIIIGLDFLFYIIQGRRIFNKHIFKVAEFCAMIAAPAFFLYLFDPWTNDCGGDSATFSPNHKISIYVLFSLCVATYFYSSYNDKMKSPIVEVFINSFLVLGFLLNIIVAIQIMVPYWLFGNVSIGILYIMQFINNHKKFLSIHGKNGEMIKNSFEKYAWKILNYHPFIKLPILLIICIPILTIITSFLLLFGQKPDSMIRAFTDTYKHGFSQLDYMCRNVQCGEHFLCSVAANGHKGIVHPIRYGERRGGMIICNRQLLIANAFEELIEEKMPKTHRIIRSKYNRVGNFIHRYYKVFNNKLIADLVYLLMKPLEWFFLIVLYTCDQKPENRIAKQYVSKK